MTATCRQPWAKRSVRVGLADQCGSVGRPILILFGLLHGLLRLNDPLEATAFFHFPFNKGRFPGENGEDCAQKIRGIIGIDLVGLTAFEQFDNFGEFGIGVADLRDTGIARLDQSHKRNGLRVGGEIDLHDRFGLMFFGRVKLGEAWALDMCLPIFGGTSDGFLLGAILDEPDLGAIAAGIPDQNDLENRILRL